VAQTFALACTEVKPLFFGSERVRRVRRERERERVTETKRQKKDSVSDGAKQSLEKKRIS